MAHRKCPGDAVWPPQFRPSLDPEVMRQIAALVAHLARLSTGLPIPQILPHRALGSSPRRGAVERPVPSVATSSDDLGGVNRQTTFGRRTRDGGDDVAKSDTEEESTAAPTHAFTQAQGGQTWRARCCSSASTATSRQAKPTTTKAVTKRKSQEVRQQTDWDSCDEPEHAARVQPSEGRSGREGQIRDG